MLDEVFITLGTAGGPIARPERAGLSNVLQVNNKSYIFDAGAAFTRQLAACEISLLEISNIFLTHLHDDHYAGIASFIGELWTLRPDKPVRIYGPPLTSEVVEGALKFQSPNRIIREVERKYHHSTEIFHVEEIAVGSVYQDEDVSVTAIENTHFHFPDGSPPAGLTQSLSFRIETKNRITVVTGDTGAFVGLADFACNADLLITEVIDPDEVLGVLQAMSAEPWPKEVYDRRKFHMEEEHMTPETVAALATKASVRKVVLTHFPPRKTGDKWFNDFVKRVRQDFDGEVIAAKDLDRF